MNNFCAKFSFIFVFVFVQFNLFSMRGNSQVPYNIQAYERLIAFGEEVDRDDHLFENENLSRIKLEDMDFNNVVFSGNDFNHSCFKKLFFEFDSQFINSILVGTLFKSVFIDDSEIKNSNFFNSLFIGSVFNNSVIRESSFKKTKFINCRFANMRIDARLHKKCFVYNNEFDYAHFEFCTFSWVGFRNNSFVDARFENTEFNKCFIVGTDFERVVFKDVVFNKCIFVDCKNLHKAFFTNNVVFNNCEFVKEDQPKHYSRRLIYTIENLGAKVIKKTGAMDKFKNILGSMIGLAVRSEGSIITDEPSSLGVSIFRTCNHAYSVWLAQNQ